MRRTRRSARRASGIQLAQASLLPIEPTNLGMPYGLHPALAELQTLFTDRKMAILANVGTLVAADHAGAIQRRDSANVAVLARRSAGPVAERVVDRAVRHGLGRTPRRPGCVSQRPQRLPRGDFARRHDPVRDRRLVDSALDSGLGHLRPRRLRQRVGGDQSASRRGAGVVESTIGQHLRRGAERHRQSGTRALGHRQPDPDWRLAARGSRVRRPHQLASRASCTRSRR